METIDMNTVTIEVSTPEKTNKRLLSALDGQEQGNYISFPTPEALWKTYGKPSPPNAGKSSAK